jgi:predicted  nucleic acid-binding Zn-ribbon protein
LIVNFSNFDAKERPLLILKNASGSVIGVLGYAYNIELDIKLNETSKITFDIPFKVDGEEVPYYDDVIGMRIVELKGIGQFTLVDPQVSDDGISKIKSCTGYSLEYEFAYKKLTLPSDTYNFYDITANENTLMSIILEKMPSWSIGSIATTLIGKYRTFEVSNENLYNFIKDTVQSTYNCIFDFDTINRKIYVIDASDSAASKAVFISLNNLASKIEVTEDTENIATRLDVNGADGVNIRDVNPCGTNKIINLDYFMNTTNFSGELIDKYNKWKKVVEDNQESYYIDSVEYSLLISKRTTAEAKLVDLKSELTSLENIQAVTIQAIAQGLKTQADLDEANANISAKQAEITAKETEITEVQADVDTAMSQLKAVQAACSFEGYFTEDEQKQLDKYMKDSEISDSSFAVVENGLYDAEGTGADFTEYVVSINNASITKVISAAKKTIYSVTGGSLKIGDLIETKSISSVIDIDEDNTFVATAYLSSGTYSGNSFESACISIVGDATNVTDDTTADDIGQLVGTALSFTAKNGYLYFTFNTTEYQQRTVAWELYQYGKEVLDKLSQPTYTFSVTSANFLALSDFVSFKNSIELGSQVYIQMEDDTSKQNAILKPICIGIQVQYEKPESLTLEFSDSYVSSDSAFELADLLGESVSTSKTVDASKYIYSSFVDSGANNTIKAFMNSALDTSKNAIMTSTEQAISWDGSGFKLRKYADSSKSTYDPEQIWMINNSIVMTDDGWATAKMAVGKFYDQNLGMCWGIVAPMIVGTLLAGNELVIESTAKDGSGNSVFHVDGEGVRLYNGDIGITKGSSQIVLNPQVGIAIGKYPVYTIDDMGAYSINTDNAKFWADSDGNLNFTGVLKGASGEFKGAIKATSLEIVGEDETTTPISTYIDDRAKDVSDGAVSIAQKALQNNIDTVSQSVADTKTELQENIDDVNNVVNNNSQNIETIESKTNSALNQIADTQTEVIQLQEASSTAAENIEVLNTKIALANDGISVVQTATSELEGRVTTIESGVHISGSEIGIYSSNSPYKNTITNDGWVISEDGQPVITCAETKLTAPRVQITDALIIGNLAWKPGSDNHLRLLKYGR